MEDINIINQIRAFNFILGLLENQNDPYCKVCLSFAKNIETIRKRFMEFERSSFSKVEDVPETFQKQLKKLYELISLLQEPENPVGQRKIGNCNFPEKICLVQESASVFDKVI